MAGVVALAAAAAGFAQPRQPLGRRSCRLLRPHPQPEARGVLGNGVQWKHSWQQQLMLLLMRLPWLPLLLLLRLPLLLRLLSTLPVLLLPLLLLLLLRWRQRRRRRRFLPAANFTLLPLLLQLPLQRPLVFGMAVRAGQLCSLILACVTFLLLLLHSPLFLLLLLHSL